ncbi:hypothetical protein [Acrocarpospora catenulata]|uniref:hypothetical protein n=1 Tax=Acrocarpospora catenulata TaxID=2836182 RepID=UPI001BDB1B0E|nr:hypothetical protein [Acrocarpospora catenulata]
MPWVGSDAEGSPARARRDLGSEASPQGDPRAWSGLAAELLGRGRPEAALKAARQAVEREPHGEWGHRLASLALERLDRAPEAVEAAQEAVRLAPGSWAARLRLAGALRLRPGRWRDAWAEAQKAVKYAPEEPGPHALSGDLALARGDRSRAATHYRAALQLDPEHTGARINLGLTLLGWPAPRDEDPDGQAARQVLLAWSRQVRILLAVALVAVTVAALGFDLHLEAQIGGAAVLAPVLAVTVRQAGRLPSWARLAAVLGRDLWLSLSVAAAPAVVAGYVAGLATLPVHRVVPAAFAGAAGLVLFNQAAILVLRLLVEAWQGRPLAALAEFGAAAGERVARRNMDVALWIVAGRSWWGLLLVSVVAPAGASWAAFAGLGVPVVMVLIGRRANLRGVVRRDRWLVAALAFLVASSICLAVAGVMPDMRRAWQGAWLALLAVLAAFGARAVRARWRGSPGPWRAALIPFPIETGDTTPSSDLTDEVRHAVTFSRSVVLSYAGPHGPRSMAVSAVTSVSRSGELRVIAGEESWEAVQHDPRVAIFVGDPRFWAEVRGIAIADNDVLRITPREVTVREYPGRRQARTQ